MIPVAVQPWVQAAYRELAFGVTETPGPDSTPRIVEYHHVGAPDYAPDGDEVSWCAAFVGWCLAQAGEQGTGQALARSYLTWGRPAAPGTWGSVVVIRRGTEPWQGHVGFCVGYDGSRVYVLGGNQHDRVSIEAIDGSRVLDWRLPERR